MDAYENVYMELHLVKVNAHAAVRWSNKTRTAAANKQTGLESFMITRILLLVLNSVFQRFLQCLQGVYCSILHCPLNACWQYIIALKQIIAMPQMVP